MLEMDTKFLWSGACTRICIALLIAQLNASELTDKAINAIDIEPLTHGSSVQTTSEPHEPLAYGTIVPMPLTQTLPVADLMDVASRAALQSNKVSASATQSNAPTSTDSARRHKLPFTFQPTTNAPEPSPQPNTLLDFKLQLSPAGFHRPQWQDMQVRQYFFSDEPTVKPFVVMLDPGHGGSDPGAIGHNGLLEKDLTLDIARRVRLFLTEFEHIDVRLTRHHDYGLSRQSRVESIKRSDADMVISLHFNHLPQSDVNLVESYYAGAENIRDSMSSSNSAQMHRTANANSRPDFRFTSNSKTLANTLHQRVFAEVSLDNDQVKNAGVKQETLFVLTRSFTPGVLLEISCLSHPAEADKLAFDAYRDRLAAALADGIRHHHDSLINAPVSLAEKMGA